MEWIQGFICFSTGALAGGQRILKEIMRISLCRSRIRYLHEKQRDFAEAQLAGLVRIEPESHQKKAGNGFTEPLPASFSWYARQDSNLRPTDSKSVFYEFM